MIISKITNFFIKVLKPRIVTASVPVIIQNKNKEILLGKRYKRNILYPGYWSLLGGIIEYGETPEMAATREIKEELGVEIKILKEAKRTYTFLSNKKYGIQSVGVVLYAEIIKGSPKPKNETKEVKWFKPKEIKKMNLAYNHKEILKGEKLI